MFGGYPSHKHYNPYLNEAESIYEMYQFEYSGQWWDLMSMWVRVFLFSVPVFLAWCFYNAESKMNERGLTIFRNAEMGQGYRRGEQYRLEY